MPAESENQSPNRPGSKQKVSRRTRSASRSVAQDAVHAASPAPPSVAGRVTRWGLRLGVIVALAWAIGYLPLQLFGERGLAQYRRLKQERIELRVRNRKLAAEIRQMRLQVERLREDDVFLEKAAREDLGMVRKGELVFVIEEK